MAPLVFGETPPFTPTHLDLLWSLPANRPRGTLAEGPPAPPTNSRGVGEPQFTHLVQKTLQAQLHLDVLLWASRLWVRQWFCCHSQAGRDGSLVSPSSGRRESCTLARSETRTKSLFSASCSKRRLSRAGERWRGRAIPGQRPCGHHGDTLPASTSSASGNPGIAPGGDFSFSFFHKCVTV